MVSAANKALTMASLNSPDRRLEDRIELFVRQHLQGLVAVGRGRTLICCRECDENVTRAVSSDATHLADAESSPLDDALELVWEAGERLSRPR